MRRIGRLRWVLAFAALPIILVLFAHALLVYVLPLDRVIGRISDDLGYPVHAASITTRARLTLAYLEGDHIVLVRETTAERRRFLELRHRLLTAR